MLIAQPLTHHHAQLAERCRNHGCTAAGRAQHDDRFYRIGIRWAQNSEYVISHQLAPYCVRLPVGLPFDTSSIGRAPHGIAKIGPSP